MCDIIERHCTDSHRLTDISGLTLFRIENVTRPQHLIYHPRIVVIAQGSKQVQLGRNSFWLNPKKILVVTVDVPVATQIYMATNGMPHLAFTLDLDLSLLAEVLQDVPAKPISSRSFPGIAATTTTFNLFEPFMRLLRLLDQPNDIEFVAPLIVKEIYFRLIQSNLGDVLTQFSLNRSHVLQIRQVTNWIKLHYANPMSIETLAKMANMSVSSFHRHFKNLTLMSPIQYRTQIRLQEARRILLSEGERAGAVGVRVGYESQSQFTRDYKRMFGAPPVMDTTRLMTNRVINSTVAAEANMKHRLLK